MKEIVFMSGLPRSGSTLLCNLLASHPQIEASSSSPLNLILDTMRKNWSDDPFLLSQLDGNFDAVYDRLKRSTVAFVNEWCRTQRDIYVDKCRGWIFKLETLRHLYPNFKMIITLRDLRQIFASVEKKHRKTLLLDFPDHMEHDVVEKRMNQLFAPDGIVGSILKGIYNIGDIPDINSHLFYWRYEDFLADPYTSMNSLFGWIGVGEHRIDLNNIGQITQESDSHYRMKYSHKIGRKFKEPDVTPISPRLMNSLVSGFQWYYQAYYPVENSIPPSGPIVDVARPENQPQQVQPAQQVAPSQPPTALAPPSLVQSLEKAISQEVNIKK